MGIGLSGGGIAVVVLVAVSIYGGAAVGHGIKKGIHGVAHLLHRSAKVATQPVRHPQKDLKKIARLPEESK